MCRPLWMIVFDFGIRELPSQLNGCLKAVSNKSFPPLSHQTGADLQQVPRTVVFACGKQQVASSYYVPEDPLMGSHPLTFCQMGHSSFYPAWMGLLASGM